VFENLALRKIFVPTGEEVVGGLKVHELIMRTDNLHSC
jgi:hypothetical protein